ncbi:MAG: protein adenylyltransferase SelO [Acidimicrobiales bacterium]
MTAPPIDVPIRFDNSYARELDGAYAVWLPAAVSEPRLIAANHELAAELGLPTGWLDRDDALAVLAGNAVPNGSQPLAQAYSGHQFGQLSPLLGDGRAVLLGEVVDIHGRTRDVALKGSGRTPFSRGGDGRAALGPVLREYLMGEAMWALGVPTTRALAAVATGEEVRRDTLLPGAVLTRVAASHLRVGTFEFAARQSPELLRRLADYAIDRHDPDLRAVTDDVERYLLFLAAVIDRQAALIARWMGVGFIHGVMNTDNMTISGETIDYGPCAFMEAYDPRTAFSSIDHGRRYAYGNQPAIGLWNLARLAESLGPLVGDDADTARDRLVPVLDGYEARYHEHWTGVIRAKLGLAAGPGDGPGAAADRELADAYLGLLQRWRVDFTLGWRRLTDAAGSREGETRLRSLFAQAALAGGGRPVDVGPADGGPSEPVGSEPPDVDAELKAWLVRWRARRDEDVGEVDQGAMRRANPIFIPRNHRVEEALAAAVDHDDLGPLERLLSILAEPGTERVADDAYAEPAPVEVTAGYRTFCGT